MTAVPPERDGEPSVDVAILLARFSLGGAERLSLELARGLATRGYTVELVACTAEGPMADQVPADVRVVDLGAGRPMRSIPAIGRYLRRTSPRVLLAPIYNVAVAALLARRLYRTSTPVVVRIENMMSIQSRVETSVGLRIARRLIPVTYPDAARIISLSREARRDFGAYIGIPEERMEIIYNPVDRDAILEASRAECDHPWLRSPGPPVILGVGRLTTVKDFATLVRAFRIVRAERSVRLVILGEGSERVGLEQLAEELGIREDVDLRGYVSNPYAYLGRASAFVLSSRWEGLANALVEAVATGIPVVSTECPGGAKEVLEGIDFATLVPVGDARAMATALAAAVDSPRGEPSAAWMDRFGLQPVLDRYEVALGLR